MDKLNFKDDLTEAIHVIDVAVWIARLQIESKRYFIFEHPALASSWRRPNMQELASMPGVNKSTFHQCMFGLTSKSQKMPMQKATTLLSNVPGIYSRFNKVYCDGRHTHQQIEGEEGGCRGGEGGEEQQHIF